MQYKIGDKVVITGNRARHLKGELHILPIGAECSVVEISSLSDTYCILEDSSGLRQTVPNHHFRHLDESVAGDANALRERHGRRTDLGIEGEGGTTYDMADSI